MPKFNSLAEMQEYSKRKSAAGFRKQAVKRSSNEQFHAGLLEAVERFLHATKSNNQAHVVAALADLESRATLSRKHAFPK